jgi:hypothetical protein
LKQLITTTTVSLVDYKNNYTETSNLLVLKNKTILTDPKLINSGTIVLPVSPDFSAIRGFASTYVEIASTELIYVKVTIEDDLSLTDNNSEGTLSFTFRTSRFSYNNPNLPVIVSVANGTMEFDNNTQTLVASPLSKAINLEFVYGVHDYVNNYGNIQNQGLNVISSGDF